MAAPLKYHYTTLHNIHYRTQKNKIYSPVNEHSSLALRMLCTGEFKFKTSDAFYLSNFYRLILKAFLG